MTVSSAKSKAGPYVATGSSQTFPRDFLVQNAAHVRVIRARDGVETDLTSGISHTGIGTASGTVTITTGIQAGDVIYLLRAVPKLQLSDYNSQGRVSPEQVERDFDVAMMALQDIAEQQARALTLGVSSDLSGEDALRAIVQAPGMVTAAAEAAQRAQSAAILAQAIARPASRATIDHIRTGSVVYNRITVRGDYRAITKTPGPNFNPADGTQDIIALRDAARLLKKRVIVNCDAAFEVTPGRYRSASLQIVDGVAIRNFVDDPWRKEAIVMYRDGQMRAARLSDGKTAQQYVAEGAVWSGGWGPLLVVNGVGQSMVGTPIETQISARTVIGQKADGDYVILTVEGKTNQYGINGPDLVALCLAEGMQIAMNLDGGGSTQCWWDTAYAHPSSDNTERTMAGYLVLDVDDVPAFDTGDILLPRTAAFTSGQIRLRQVNERLSCTFSLEGGPIQTTEYQAMTSSLPQRFWPESTSDARGFGHGSFYDMIAIGMPGPLTGEIFARAKVKAETAILGTLRWDARWSSPSAKPL